MVFLPKKKKKSHNDGIPGVTFTLKLRASDGAGKGWQQMTHLWSGDQCTLGWITHGTVPAIACTKLRGLDPQGMIDVLG